MNKHPLSAFANAVEQSGKRFYSIRYMQLCTQKVSPLIFLILLVGCTNGLAPLPLKIFGDRHFIYLDPKNPSDVSLRNTDPSTFQYRSEIDLTKGPEIL